MPCPDDQGVVGRLHADHVQRLRGGDTQAAPLPHGVKRQSLMLAEHLAGGVDDRPRLQGARVEPGPQERPVIAVRNETDFLALRLRRHLEAELRRHVRTSSLLKPPSGNMAWLSCSWDRSKRK